MFEKVLVANRGEIAVRIIRALDELGIASVAVYSEIDRDALHVRRAGEAYLLGARPGGGELPQRATRSSRSRARPAPRPSTPATASWPRTRPSPRPARRPGSPSSGRPPSAIEAMGSKTRARELMQAAGVPIVPGTTEPVATVDDARRIATDEIGYPVAVKAAGGGGGKGFRVALDEAELEAAFEGASREGEKFFSDPTVYLERYLTDPRHVEVQVLADAPRRRHPPRRARLLGPAPPPEAHRGVARPGRRRRHCATGSARSPPTPRAPSTTAARARSRASSRTASTSSWR